MPLHELCYATVQICLDNWLNLNLLFLNIENLLLAAQISNLPCLIFVRDVSHLPSRILDLLEIAAYVFCADRLASRGRKDNVEYHSWPRLFHFVIKVRDFDFWDTHDVKEKT